MDWTTPNTVELAAGIISITLRPDAPLGETHNMEWFALRGYKQLIYENVSPEYINGEDDDWEHTPFADIRRLVNYLREAGRKDEARPLETQLLPYLEKYHTLDRLQMFLAEQDATLKTLQGRLDYAAVNQRGLKVLFNHLLVEQGLAQKSDFQEHEWWLP